MGVCARPSQRFALQPFLTQVGGQRPGGLQVCSVGGSCSDVGAQKEQPWDDVRETKPSHEVSTLPVSITGT